MLTDKERMLTGLAHQPYDNELAELRLRNKELLYEYNILTRPSDKKNKERLILTILGKATNTPHINSPFYCDYGQFIEIGKNFFANYNCTILDTGGVRIGDDVLFAPNVSLYTVGHPIDPELRKAEWEQALPIVIGNNVWIGGNVVILGGVTIGDNSVIGAGSIVTQDIPANCVAVGNPCRVLRTISAKDRDDYLQRFKPNLND
ncbi:sugar O-acetyltransferase [Pasteurella canis]|uniref:Acetyltransferase n=1 Tax=Pasteurella canis TaxID=753 RepID=A0ABQ4VD05_9PAST|nr:sugar O-acetyltransferase [Pasteurella canis]UAX42302.1 sugar O-acetyltransferase [Pasteurella canis]UAY77857.1 sugar O-acetyltransferase [Pasteurella canis]UEA16949.1 sugar O-acetyltransferase [Pasteurella canis]UEC23388.1 sugar O-acetyltransferase [Pasteurella canis]SPY33701.1 galactoside O-acetyltransferase [Pasteurella canis]